MYIFQNSILYQNTVKVYFSCHQNKRQIAIKRGKLTLRDINHLRRGTKPFCEAKYVQAIRADLKELKRAATLH